VSSCHSGVEMEMSPYIHSLFKIATFQSNGLGVKDVVELRISNISWSSAVSSGVETLEADSQELCSQPYPFYLIRYWNLLQCQQLLSISSTSHSASLSMTIGGGWSSILRPVIGSSGARVSFTMLNTRWSCFIWCDSFRR